MAVTIGKESFGSASSGIYPFSLPEHVQPQPNHTITALRSLVPDNRVLSLMAEYNFSLKHALEVGAQTSMLHIPLNFIIKHNKSGQGPEKKEIRKDHFDNVIKMVELSHLIDDAGDEKSQLPEFSHARTSMNSALLDYQPDQSHATRNAYLEIKNIITESGLISKDSLPLLMTIENLLQSDPVKTEVYRTSMLRLLASGLAQTELSTGIKNNRTNNTATYKQLIDVVRTLSLQLTTDTGLSMAIANAKPEMLIGAMASGSQELFPLVVPEIQMTPDYLNLLQACNMLLGPLIYFDEKLADRLQEGISFVVGDYVTQETHYTDFADAAVKYLVERINLGPKDPNLIGHLKQIAVVKEKLSHPYYPHRFSKIKRNRPEVGNQAKAKLDEVLIAAKQKQIDI